jgi:hypothetical protein
MPRVNYRQAKRHREDSRKKRQLEKRERKMARNEEVAPATNSPVNDPNSDSKPSP